MAKQSVNAGSLAELAKKIEDCAAEVDSRTIEAAFLVRQLRSRIEAGEAGPVTWYQWAPKHINLCRSRLRELQRIAEADDPRAELARVRKLAAERAARHRQRQAPLRNGGANGVREQLIEWAQTAPHNSVAEVMQEIKKRCRDASRDGSGASAQVVGACAS